MTKDLTRDHILAKSRGGENTYDNIVPACSDCNGFKEDKSVLAMLVKMYE